MFFLQYCTALPEFDKGRRKAVANEGGKRTFSVILGLPKFRSFALLLFFHSTCGGGCLIFLLLIVNATTVFQEKIDFSDFPQFSGVEKIPSSVLPYSPVYSPVLFRIGLSLSLLILFLFQCSFPVFFRGLTQGACLQNCAIKCVSAGQATSISLFRKHFSSPPWVFSTEGYVSDFQHCSTASNFGCAVPIMSHQGLHVLLLL